MQKKVKAKARRILKGHFLKAAAVMLMFFAAAVLLFLLEQAVLSLCKVTAPEIDLFDPFTMSFYAENTYLLITAVFWALELLVFSLLISGAKLWFFEIARQNAPPFSLLFYAFHPKHFLRFFTLRVHVFLEKFPARILEVLPAAAVFTAAFLTTRYQSFYASLSYGFLVCCGILLLTAGWGLSSYYNLRFFLADCLCFIYPDISVGEAVRHSAFMVRRARKGFFLLKCSFLPWGILSLLVFPLFWAVPYYLTAMSVPAAWLCRKMPLYSGGLS